MCPCEKFDFSATRCLSLEISKILTGISVVVVVSLNEKKEKGCALLSGSE